MAFDVMLVLTQIMKFGFDIGFKLEMFIHCKSYMDEILFCKVLCQRLKNNECWQNLKKCTFSQINPYKNMVGATKKGRKIEKIENWLLIFLT
jgi:hypothetical protein